MNWQAEIVVRVSFEAKDKQSAIEVAKELEWAVNKHIDSSSTLAFETELLYDTITTEDQYKP